MRRAAAVLGLAWLLAALPARAAEPTPPPPPRSTPAPEWGGRLSYHPVRDPAVTAAIGGLVVAAEILKSHLAPDSCRWCDTGAGGADRLDGFDASARRHLRWSRTGTAGTLSTISAGLLAPAVAAGWNMLAARRSGHDGDAFPNAVIVAQAGAVALAAAQVTKFIAGRQRPFVHALSPAERAARPADPEDNLSFFSGHTAVAFSVAVAGGTLASRRGYPAAKWIWASGLTCAAATGWLRIAADEHYATDVLAGAAAGTLAGWAVVRLAHGPPGPGDATGLRVVAPAPGQLCALEYRW